MSLTHPFGASKDITGHLLPAARAVPGTGYTVPVRSFKQVSRRCNVQKRIVSALLSYRFPYVLGVLKQPLLNPAVSEQLFQQPKKQLFKQPPKPNSPTLVLTQPRMP